MNHDEFAIVAHSGWFDGEKYEAGPVTVRVQDGRIASIASGNHGAVIASQGIPIYQGAYLMPGLVDAHVHLFLDGGSTDGSIRSAHMKKSVGELIDAARISARQSVEWGVTLVRDAGDKHGVNHAIRSEAENPRLGMCRVHSGGSGIKRAKRYGAFMARDVDDENSIRQSVTELAKSNDEIKIILTGIIDFDAGEVTDEPQFTLDETELIVATASLKGRKTFSHCSGTKGLAIASRAGVGSIEHGFFMSREILQVMRDRNVAWTPTFSPVHFQWAFPDAVGWSANTIGNLRRILDDHAKHLSLAHEMGVTLLLGTDAGSMGVEHGKAMVEEIRRFLEAGIPLDATLKAATANNRQHFGMPRLITLGAPFDAALFNHDPFVERDLFSKPQQVWMGNFK